MERPGGVDGVGEWSAASEGRLCTSFGMSRNGFMVVVEEVREPPSAAIGMLQREKNNCARRAHPRLWAQQAARPQWLQRFTLEMQRAA
jgi:hypothetical protein